MSSAPTMRAVTQDHRGGPEVLYIAEVPRPVPRTNEILVRVRAAGLNPTDWKHRANGGFLGSPPFTLGWDVSGVVHELGVGVARFSVGDEVYGMLSYPFGHGSHAEFVAAPARLFAHKPAELDHVSAGALPLVSLTAWQALVENAELRAGQRVLVHAAAGGVGHIAVQIAKSLGAHVIGTASREKHELLRSIGVDETIDYRATDFDTAVSKVDVVLDTIGGDYSTRSLRVLRPGGIVVSILPVGSDEFYEEAERLGVRGVRMLVDSSHAHLDSVSDLVRKGKVSPIIAATFPLDAVVEAHRLGDRGRTAGKIVLTFD